MLYYAYTSMVYKEACVSEPVFWLLQVRGQMTSHAVTIYIYGH